MTTLPQTTGARFPRAGVRTPSIPALAQAGGSLAAPGQGGGNSMTVGDVMRVLRANLVLIISLLLLGLIAGYLINEYVLNKYYKKFTAVAVLQVQSPETYDPINGNIAGAYGDRTLLEVRQKTLSQKLLSPDLWRPLLTNPNSPVRNTDWVRSFADTTGGLDTAAAIDAVQKNLGVNPTPQTELITVSLAAPSAEDAKVVLDGIVTQLVNTEQGDLNLSQSDERKTYAQFLQRYSSQIANLEQRVNDASGRLNMARDSSGGGNGLLTARQIELSGLIGERLKKESVYQEAAGQYKSVVNALDAGQLPAEASQVMDFNPTIQRLEGGLDEMNIQIATRLTQYSPDHRLVKEAEAQRDAIKTQLEEKRNNLRVSIGASFRDSANSKMQAAEADLKITLAQIQEAETKLGQLQRELSEYTRDSDQLAYLKEKRNKIEERIGVLEAGSARDLQRRSTVRLWGPVERPAAQSFPNLKLTLGVGGMMGLGLALGIAFLREMMDTTVRSPRDITKVGQLNLLGMIPHTDDDPQAAAADLSLAISAAPNSIIAENFRQVRTRLQHAASLDTTRSLLVTSPGPGDGKTTVACNIAAGLALNGRKILLVDANFRRPELHRVFGVGNDTGFGSVLSGAAQVEQAAHKTNVPNLEVLTTGPRPANPTELLESQLLTDFIDRSLEEYDHVIFDTGPILLVSETVALAPRVDGVVTVVRAKNNSRGLLQRMRDALRQLKAEHLGVVLNGVRQHTGGYYRRNIKNYYAYQNGND